MAGALEESGSKVTLRPGLAGTLEEANRLLEQLDLSPPTVVVAIGGGQPIDVAKLAASRARVDVVVVPTALSHDGVSSPVASLAFPDGIRRSLAAGMPAGVVVDLDVVRATPPHLLRAGIGDLVSNLTAVADWRLSRQVTGEALDEFAASIAVQAAAAVFAAPWPLDDVGLAELARGLVVSGLAMEVAGSSRPCSGAEHLISHALDNLLGRGAHLHGEQVALGCLVSASLHDAHVEELRDLFGRCGLATTVAASGIDEDLLVRAIQHAPQTRRSRFTVLDTVDLAEDAVRDLVRRAFR